MKKKIGIVVAALVLVVLVCVGFYFVKKGSNKNTTELTEVQMIITRNLEKDYPLTPRQVVSFYNRIIKAYYGESFSDEEFEKMVDQTRKLFDDELLENNPRAEYVSALKAEITSYNSNNKTISSSDVSDSSDIKYKNDTQKDDSLAFVDASYFMKEGKSTFTKTYMQFVLRKDENGEWKILGFYKIDAPSSED